MDGFSFINPYRRRSYMSIVGTVVEINPVETGNRRNMGCSQMVTIEDEEGNIANFIVSPNTYVVDCTKLYESMAVEIFFDADAAMPLIYPPQYNAAVVVNSVPGMNWAVGYFNSALMNSDQTLKLNIAPSTEVTTMNHQNFLGTVANHNLIVQYDVTTRSIPAQTTPVRVIVMCSMN